MTKNWHVQYTVTPPAHLHCAHTSECAVCVEKLMDGALSLCGPRLISVCFSVRSYTEKA